MSSLNEKLSKLTSPIRIGLLDAGYMGSGLFNVINDIKGMEVTALYDPDRKLAGEVAAGYGTPSPVIADSVEHMCSLPEIDVVVDVTFDPALGAQAGYHASKNKKHLVSLNIEADVTVGFKLKKLFEENGVIYTVGDGDEPSELKKFYDHYKLLNFDVIACGKGKNNPLNVEATPDTVRGKLPRNGITARQVASFVDGSKTMFEMACLSNATGLVPDVRGMHGPEARLSEMTSIFQAKDRGGILEREGVVDYVTGTELSGGIFIIVRTHNKRLQSDLEYLKIGKGDTYLFYQRYHNWFVDLPLAVAKVCLEGKPTLVPLDEPSCQVIAAAKRDLKSGDVLDGIGAFTVYGIIEKNTVAKQQNALPLGLAEGMRVKKDVRRGEIITFDSVEREEESLLTKLWPGG